MVTRPGGYEGRKEINGRTNNSNGGRISGNRKEG